MNFGICQIRKQDFKIRNDFFEDVILVTEVNDSQNIFTWIFNELVFRVVKKLKDLKKGAQNCGQNFLQLSDLRFLSYRVSNVHSREQMVPGGTNGTMGIVL